MKKLLLLVAGALCAVQPAFCGILISSANTDQARYSPGSLATIYVNLTNTSGSFQNGNVAVTLTHLGSVTATLPTQGYSLSNGASTSLTFYWTTPASDLTGYSVEINATNSSGTAIDSMNSAIDVSSTWTRFPRYGYVGTYPSNLTNATAFNELWLLKNFHIDGVQFYDWQWKQHVPLAGSVSSPAASWQNIDGSDTNYASAVNTYISAAHYYGMSTMEYNLAYGAFSNYASDGSGVSPQWGLYTQSNGTNQWNNPLPSGWATSTLDIFDPSNYQWQNYIAGQEKDVFAAYDFDGWQVDQLGNWGTMYSYSGAQVDYGAAFPNFLNTVGSQIGKPLVFNSVGGFGLPGVLPEEAFAYVECWPSSNGGTQNNYNDLKSVVDSIASASSGKSVVLAAYMDSAYANTTSNGYFNPPGVLLTDAAIFAMGASHIELGSGIGGNDQLDMLDGPYFPNTNLLPSSSLLSTLQSYYDFDVAYENLLRGTLPNSSNAITFSQAHSIIAADNEIWAFAKTDGNTHMLNIINLLNASNTNWRDDNANYPQPPTQTNLVTKYYYGSGAAPTGLFWASPDVNSGRMSSISFSFGSDSGGSYIRFTLPTLQYWDMVYITT